MSRRTLAEVNQALMVRRLQQDAALHKLQAQQLRVQDARGKLNQSIDDHFASETAWAAALEDIGDIEMISLQRTHTAALLDEVRSDENRLAEATDALSELHHGWRYQTRLAEAVQGVARTAVRKVRRADDERRLVAAEDARMARRVEG